LRPHEIHRAKGKAKLNVVLVTVSSSRHAAQARGEAQPDESGDQAEKELLALGHRVAKRLLLSDDKDAIQSAVKEFVAGKSDVLVLTGGTGVSPRDVTIEAVRPFLDKELEGFGELLRAVSFRHIGSAAAITRATAGVSGGKLIVCLPGSPDAVRVGLRAFGREMPHVLFVAGA